MRIKSLKYIDHSTGWRLDRTEFGKLSLLVGISGVGKSKILQAIWNIHRIANGESLLGVEWEIEFSMDSDNYMWCGKFKKSHDVTLGDLTEPIVTESFSTWSRYRIQSERFIFNEQEVFKRELEGWYINNNRVDGLSSYISGINIFIEEKVIGVFLQELRKNIWHHNRGDQRFLGGNKITVPIEMLERYKKELNGIEDVRTLTYSNKSFLLELCDKKGFNKLVSDFSSIFPKVEEVSYNEVSRDAQNVTFELYIKESNPDSWISSVDMSAGMYKTFMLLADLELAPEGSIILIDEFENSLGVNCIDTVAEYITDSDRDIQFIITSHHPYIINNIGMQHWKIVQREGSRVFTSTAEELKLGRSKHQAFMQLMNSPAYENGIS